MALQPVPVPTVAQQRFQEMLEPLWITPAALEESPPSAPILRSMFQNMLFNIPQNNIQRHIIHLLVARLIFYRDIYLLGETDLLARVAQL